MDWISYVVRYDSGIELVMSQQPVYLDNAATTRPDPRVIEAIRAALAEDWGNPSSAHIVGSDAKMRLEEARAAIAQALGCESDEVYFTSGGTEADNWALLGMLDFQRGRKNHLITLSTEHHAIIDTAKWWRERGGDVTILDVDRDGRIAPDAVARAVTPHTALVSVMHVNNELGTIQDVAAIGAACREKGVPFHTDCVQSFGKLAFKFADLNADLVSISSHKIYGPKGVGAMIVRRGIRISQRTIGGSQERGLRPGTENMPGIVGFAKAAELAHQLLPEEMPRLRILRDRLEQEIQERIPDIHINGSREHRAPALLNVSFCGCEGEALLIALDRRGFCVSTGSACSAGALGASHVLIGIGLDPLTAQAAIRFSFGRFNTDDDVNALMKILPSIVERQRQTAGAAFRV
jgi:cysteine desulfurase